MPADQPAVRHPKLDECFSVTGALSSLARKDKARRGEVVGRIPLGYLPEFDGAKLVAVPDPERASLVAGAFELAARPGASLRRALAEASKSGLSNLAGRPLSHSSFHHLLTNPFYMGLIRLNGKTYPGRHIPLVTPELFYRLQGSLGERRTSKASAHREINQR